VGENVFGDAIMPCSIEPLTGFYRDACCNTGPEDVGLHVVCAEMTEEFLEFSVARGNDLVTPMPLYDFPGLVPGDRWCVCASRWQEALVAGVAPPVILVSTHRGALAIVELADLEAHAI